MFIASLNSGSNGNSYYIGNDTDAVLVDAGISCRETERRMKQLGLSMAIVRAIFVSHEHADHITGIPAISKKYQLPVYITPATLKAAGIPVEEQLVRSFAPHEPVRINGLSITPFPKSHDASDPYSFIITGNDITIGVFTDIGHCCAGVTRYFSQCHAAFLEANYCDDMLSKGSYPYYLKRRISGNDGHLSNTQALALFEAHRHPQLSRLILSHLSKNNNTPQLAERLFTEKANGVAITVASRYEASPVFCITPGAARQYIAPARAQLSLFNEA